MLVSQHYIEKAKELQQAVPSIKHIIVMDERPESEDGFAKYIYNSDEL